MLDQPLGVERDGIAPRHRPPLPAKDGSAAGTLAAGQGVAAVDGGKPRRRNRAGSTVKAVKQDARSRTHTPPPTSSRAAHLVASLGTPQPISPAPSLLMGGDGATTLLPALPQQQQRHPSQPQLMAQSPLPNSSLLPSLPNLQPSPSASTSGSSTPTASPPVLAGTTATTSTGPPPPYRPASAKPPSSRIPSFPLVDAYVPDANSTDRRHPRTLVPKDLGFPTAAMHGKVRKEDLDDRLLMATCAVLHGFENRALCPKEVAEVMLERDWLKNAGTTPFAHVSTCIRSHIARASGATPPYQPLLTPFELVGALTAEEVRAVGLHAEQRPAVKRGTLWYLNPQVFGPGVGADDPFVRCRREVGLQPSDRQGLYIRGLVPLQASMPALPPDLKMSSSIFHSNGADDHDGDEEGMGRGKRKRRASSAMMAAMSTTPATPSPLATNVPLGTASPVPIPATAVRAAAPVTLAPATGMQHRCTQSMSGPSSAPARSGIPRLKLRLTALEENDSSVDDSDGHTGEAAARRKKNKKKVRRAGSEGLSRAGSTEPALSEDDDLLAQSLPSHPSAFSSISSSALLAQSLLAASSPSALPRSQSVTSLTAPLHAVSPDSLSLANNGTSFPFSRPSSSHGVAVNLSMSAPNIFSHHFANAPSPPDIMDLDAPSPPTSSSHLNFPATAVSPASDSPDDEDDFHESMLRGDDLLDFEWGSDSYISTAGTSSIDAPLAATFASSTPLMLQQAELGPAPMGADQALTPASSVELDESLRQKIEDNIPQLDTPATTPRSPGKEDLSAGEAVAGEDASDEVKAEKEKAEMERGPLGIISRVGMRTTLCGEMQSLGSDEDAEHAVIVIDDDDDDLDCSQADISLISLVHETPPSAKRTPRQDSRLTAPPPSPLPLEFTSMGALTNAFAATDFDFVGHDEAHRSPFFRFSSYSSHHDDGESADDEGEGEFDDMITVKVEDGEEETMRLSSAPSSRASSAYSPAPEYPSHLLAGNGVRAGSAGSSSSDDSFDPMTFVSVPMLATGLPVPQPAPSPPETTDWTQSIDMLDDLETELAGVDLMAPEAIGLDELDLAWAGDSDEAASPTPETPNKPRLSLPRSGSAAFLTGSIFSSPHRFNSPVPSPRRISSSKLPVLADFAKKGAALPVPPTLTRNSSNTTIFSGSTDAPTPRRTPKPALPPPSSAADIESIMPLDPAVVATIVQRGVVVFSTGIVDLSNSVTFPLFRRLDTGYCNATTLLQAALPAAMERASALSAILAKSTSSAFRISLSSEPGIVGTWVSLPTARQIAAAYPDKLQHLAVFLEDDLAARFPEPIPTMRAGAQTEHQSKDVILGTPAFEGAELIRGGSTVPDSADEADEVKSEQGSVESVESVGDGEEVVDEAAPPPPRRTGRARRPTAAVQAELDAPSTTPRKSTKSRKSTTAK